jgi:hypothetical protein
MAFGEFINTSLHFCVERELAFLTLQTFNKISDQTSSLQPVSGGHYHSKTFIARAASCPDGRLSRKIDPCGCLNGNRQNSRRENIRGKNLSTPRSSALLNALIMQPED